MPYIIGLTGNIATGKSTVARMLAELGAEVIDADRLAHEVMAPGTSEWRLLVSRFGEGVLRADGSVDRRQLGEVVFRNPEALRDLESILHPGVRARIRAHFARTDAAVVVVEAIKLLEGGLYREVDTVWVVTADRPVQLRRLMTERNLTRADAEARIDGQGPQAEKVARADVVIDNSGDLSATQAQVLAAWHTIRQGGAPSRRGEAR
jgi:dephospho-CoA kinase